MRTLVELAPLAILVACATEASLDEQAKGYSTPVLCYGQRAGNDVQREAAGRELKRRSASCTDADVQQGKTEWRVIEGRPAPANTPPANMPRRSGY